MTDEKTLELVIRVKGEFAGMELNLAFDETPIPGRVLSTQYHHASRYCATDYTDVTVQYLERDLPTPFREQLEEKVEQMWRSEFS